MHIEAEARAHVAQCGELGGLGADEIAVGGEFDVFRLALEGRHLEACPFGERGVVGEIVAARRCRPPMRVEQGGKAEGLRRLHHAQMHAVDGAGDAARRVDGLDRVGHGEDRDGGAARPPGGDRARNQRLRGERPRRIVHEDELRVVRLQCFEAGANRGLPRCSPVHGRQQGNSGARRAEQRRVVGMDDGLNEGNTRVARQRGKARPDDGLPEDLPILLGQIPARAQPAAACHDDGCDTRSHVLPRSKMTVGMALARRGRGAKWRLRRPHSGL